jgi:hypothetical protein
MCIIVVQALHKVGVNNMASFGRTHHTRLRDTDRRRTYTDAYSPVGNKNDVHAS